MTSYAPLRPVAELWNEMASLPTLEDAERAILDVLADKGTRPGESITGIVLTNLMAGNPPSFRADDLNAALNSMAAKGWIVQKLASFYTLTDESRKIIEYEDQDEIDARRRCGFCWCSGVVLCLGRASASHAC